jgi:hypothetical protein
MDSQIMPTPQEIMQAEHARNLREAQEKNAAIEHDMRELERIVMTYGLVVIAPDSVKQQPTKLHPSAEEFSDFERAKMVGESIIRSSGRPMTVAELFPIMLERGVKFPAGAPPQRLSSYLHRNPNLQFIKNYGWWIAGVPWPPGTPQKSRRGEDKAKTLEAAKRLLKGKSEPTHLDKLYADLITVGIRIPGSEPKMYLSALLSASPDFKANRRAGWTLAEKEDVS